VVVIGIAWLVRGVFVSCLWQVSGLLVVVINLFVASGWLGCFLPLAS
jgi:hypothetical protein